MTCVISPWHVPWRWPCFKGFHWVSRLWFLVRRTENYWVAVLPKGRNKISLLKPTWNHLPALWLLLVIRILALNATSEIRGKHMDWTVFCICANAPLIVIQKLTVKRGQGLRDYKTVLLVMGNKYKRSSSPNSPSVCVWHYFASTSWKFLEHTSVFLEYEMVFMKGIFLFIILHIVLSSFQAWSRIWL